MSYNNNGSNLFNGSRLYGINHSTLPNTSQVLNGKFKGLPAHESYGKRGKCQPAASQLRVETNVKMNHSEDFTDSALMDTKSKFSEKLKVLLENGSVNKSEPDDPYAFSEIDPQFTVPLNHALNSVESYIRKNVTTPQKLANIGTLKSMKVAREMAPKMPTSLGTEPSKNDAFDPFNTLKFSKHPVYNQALNSDVTSALHTPQYKIQAMSAPLGKYNAVTSNLKGMKLIQTQPPLKMKPYVKSGGKPSITNLKSPNVVNNPAKSKVTPSGKPQSYRKTVMAKMLNAKTDKKGSGSLKGISKGKPIMNQLYKTAAANKSPSTPGKPRRTTAPRSISLDCDLPLKGTFNSRTVTKKSLLEESLLGVKNVKDSGVMNIASIKALASRNSLNPGRYGTPPLTQTTHTTHVQSVQSVQTGTTTVLLPQTPRTELQKSSKHESLQRIWTVRNKMKELRRDYQHFGLTLNEAEETPDSNSDCVLFQNCWFSTYNDCSVSCHERRRDTRLARLKGELRRKMKLLQWSYKDEFRDRMAELLVNSARRQPNLTAFLLRLENSSDGRKGVGRWKSKSVLHSSCSFTDSLGKLCAQIAMPCVRFCQEHIAYCSDQQLFTTCSALRGDLQTPCNTPALDKTQEHPLCLEHKSLSQKPKILSHHKVVSKPPQPRKRSRSTPSSSRSGRSRKRKRPSKEKKEEVISMSSISIQPHLNHANTGSAVDTHKFSFGLNTTRDVRENCVLYRDEQTMEEMGAQVITKSDIDESQEVEVLGMTGDLPLDTVELTSQATRLLEEHDFTNVLNHIPADAFNDLFTEDKEEYEPTPQETEELERALEAVDKDVKSLEKLSQTQGILDTLLDEQAIAQTLAQLPGVAPTLVPVFYQNGFANLNHLEQTLHGGEGIPSHFVMQS